MKSKGFRQIDTEFWLAILAADLTRAGIKVLLAVIHFTLGYDQRDSADISLSTFQSLTKLSLPAIRTAIRELTAYELISVVAPATNRQSTVYKLNKDWRGKVDLPSGGKVDFTPDDAKTLPPDAENFTPRGKVPVPATPLLKKERKPLKKTSSGDASITGTINKSSTSQGDIPLKPPLGTDKGLVTLIFNAMKSYLGFPGKVAQDPIPSYGKEGKAIKRLLARGFSPDAIMACWRGKVADRGGDFVSMTWVNEDIGKKGGRGARKQSSRSFPKAGEYEDCSTHVIDEEGHLVQREDSEAEEGNHQAGFQAIESGPDD